MMKLISIVPLVVISIAAHATEVVRMDVQIGSSNYDIDFELFDTITPNTVQNFMNYVDVTLVNPRYDGSFFHRSVPGFIIQGGGFTYDPLFGAFEYDSVSQAFTGGLQKISADASLVNEFPGSGLSNVRGTIAMAKLAGNPDSATSEWFVNLTDNSANLDVQNEGFTVFGRVLDDGMAIFDLIEAISISDLSAIYSAMGTIPLDNYTNGNPVTQSNLIRVNSVRQILRPVIKAKIGTVDIGTVDFGLLAVGGSASLTITIFNVGNASLEMDINSIVNLSAPYSIVTEDCSIAVLAENTTDSCSITLKFDPGALGVYNSQLKIIPSVNPNNVTLSIDISGEGVPITPVTQIVGDISSLDFAGITILKTSGVQELVVRNRGGGTLSVMSVALSGVDSNLFNIANGCNAVNLATAQTCTIATDFNPIIGGIRNATLTIELNDGLNTIVKTISLTGEGLEPEIEVPLSYDAGTAQLNEPKVSGFLLNNTGNGELVITSVSISGPDAADFSQGNTCPDVATFPVQSLQALTGKCTFIITFNPATVGKKTATLTITSTDIDESVINISLTGDVGVADIELITDLDVGVSSISGIPAFNEFKVFNRGKASLNFASFDLIGPDLANYSILSDCPGISTGGTPSPLDFNESCIIVVRLQATVMGTASAQLILDSNDPDEPTVIVNLSGVGDTDIDGASANIEQSAPNFGDGNNDQVQDDVQNNVVSFITKAGSYATLAAPSVSAVADLTLPDNPDVNGSPQGILFDHGLFKFEILVTPGNAVEMAIYMPQGDASSVIYKYGPTPENNTPHWYDFSFDEVTRTGARYIGNVSIEAPGGGSPITRSMFIVSFIDGSRGDDDLLVNDIITNTMALGKVDSSNEGSSGAISWFSLLPTYFLLAWLRRFRSSKY